MGKKKTKVKKKCCEKYLKSGKHCKGCPLLIADDSGSKKKGNGSGKNLEKKKKAKVGKKNKDTKK